MEIIRENGGKIQSNNFCGLNSFPYPAFEFSFTHKSLPILTSRGCPYKCVYCGSSKLNPQFIERKAEHTINEIYYMLERYAKKHFILFDDALLINSDSRFIRIFSIFSKHKGISFHTPNGLHAKEITPEIASILFNSNFKTIRLSFESISQSILSDSSNKVNVNQMADTVKYLEQAGYKRKEIEVYVFIGYPNQYLNSLIETLSFIDELGVVPRLSYFSPVPGTPIFHSMQKNKILSDPINLYETNKTYGSVKNLSHIS